MTTEDKPLAIPEPIVRQMPMHPSEAFYRLAGTCFLNGLAIDGFTALSGENQMRIARELGLTAEDLMRGMQWAAEQLSLAQQRRDPGSENG